MSLFKKTLSKLSSHKASYRRAAATVESLSALKKDFSAINIVHHAFKMLETHADVFDKYNKSIPIYLPGCLADPLFNKLVEIKAHPADGKAWSSVVDGVYVKSKSTTGLFHFYSSNIENDTVEKINNELGRLILELFGPRFKIWGQSYNVSFGEYQKFDFPDLILSNKQSFIKDRIKSTFIDSSQRSLLLYGPPGSGKSFMCQAIAKELGGVCLSVGPMDRTRLMSLMNIIHPRVVIWDDFDRTVRSFPEKDLLDLLENIKNNCEIFIATANSIELDPAIIRPGRIDELIEINDQKDLANKIISKLDLDLETREKLLTWPVAYVKELAKRNETGACLGKEIEDLEFRLNMSKEWKYKQQQQRTSER